MQTTFPRLLLKHASERPAAPAMREKEYGIWQTTTWAEMAHMVEHIACGLHQAGLTRGEHLVVIGSNRPRLYATMLAAQSLGAVGNDAAREALLAQLTTAPERLAIEIAAALAGNRIGAEALLATITAGKASPRLLQDLNVENKLKAAGVPDIEALLQQLTAGLPPRDERIRQLIDQRREGFQRATPDVMAGQAVFKQRCAACHRLAGEAVALAQAARLLDQEVRHRRRED